MKLSAKLYEIYKPLRATLDALMPSRKDTMYFTIDSYGAITEHMDSIFFDGGCWYSEGDSWVIGHATDVFVPEEVSALLTRFIPENQAILR